MPHRGPHLPRAFPGTLPRTLPEPRNFPFGPHLWLHCGSGPRPPKAVRDHAQIPRSGTMLGKRVFMKCTLAHPDAPWPHRGVCRATPRTLQQTPSARGQVLTKGPCAALLARYGRGRNQPGDARLQQRLFRCNFMNNLANRRFSRTTQLALLFVDKRHSQEWPRGVPPRRHPKPMVARRV